MNSSPLDFLSGWSGDQAEIFRWGAIGAAGLVVVFILRVVFRSMVNKRVKSIEGVGMTLGDIDSMFKRGLISEAEYKTMRKRSAERELKRMKDQDAARETAALLAKVEKNPELARVLVEGAPAAGEEKPRGSPVRRPPPPPPGADAPGLEGLPPPGRRNSSRAFWEDDTADEHLDTPPPPSAASAADHRRKLLESEWGAAPPDEDTPLPPVKPAPAAVAGEAGRRLAMLASEWGADEGGPAAKPFAASGAPAPPAPPRPAPQPPPVRPVRPPVPPAAAAPEKDDPERRRRMEEQWTGAAPLPPPSAPPEDDRRAGLAAQWNQAEKAEADQEKKKQSKDIEDLYARGLITREEYERLAALFDQ